MLFLFGLGNIWITHTSYTFIPSKKINIVNSYQNKIKLRLNDCYNQSVISELENFPKMRTYIKFKTVNKLEDYLIHTNDLNNRFSISKLRLSSHNLRIETGRYDKLEVERRLCENCKQVDDEFHFIINCSLYNNERNVLFNSISNIDRSFKNADTNDKFYTILKAKQNICENVGIFARNCHKV